MRKHEVLPQQRIIGRPFCELCKSQMWLASIEPDEPGHDRRTFECPGCPNVTVRIVKYRATGPSPPSKLDAWYSTSKDPCQFVRLLKVKCGSPRRRQIAIGGDQELDATFGARLPIPLSFAIPAGISIPAPVATRPRRRGDRVERQCPLLALSGHSICRI